MTSIYRSVEGERAVMDLYDRALAGWPTPNETCPVNTRYGEAFVIGSGDPAARPLLLLHGAGTNSAVWVGEAAEYGRHFRLYAVDLPGEAGRSDQQRPDWNGPAFAEWLEDVLDGLGLEQAALVGTSQGAWAALKLAVRRPERVERLALLSPGGVLPDRTSFLFKALFLSLLGSRGRRRLLRLLFARQPLPEGTEEVLETVMAQFKPRVGTLPLFSDEELERLTMPILVLGGDEDVMRDVAAIGARLQRHAPDVSVRLLPGAGHALVGTVGVVLAEWGVQQVGATNRMIA